MYECPNIDCSFIRSIHVLFLFAGSDYKIIKRPESRRKLRKQDSHDEETLAKVNLKTDKLPASTSAEAVAEAALRLRSLVLRLEKDDLSQTDIKDNLKFAACVLDNFKTGDSKNK